MDNGVKYVAAVIGVIFLAFLAIYLIVSRGNNSNAPASTAPLKLTQYANSDSSVSYTVQGRIVGEDEHRAIRITINAEERRVDILAGYGDVIQKSQTFPNTATAYETFLAALDRTGFNASRKVSVTDPTGVCPLGNRFLYNLTSDGDKVVDTWGSSCRAGDGTFAGTQALVQQLFQAQITNYPQQVQGVVL